MKTGVSVQEVMTKSPITVRKEATLKECGELMGDKQVNSLVVKDKDNKVLGIAADEDFVRKAISKNLDFSKSKIEEIMVRDVVTIAPERDLYDAMKLMGDYNIRQLPIVMNKKVIGIVTSKDILKIQPALFEILQEKTRQRMEKRMEKI